MTFAAAKFRSFLPAATFAMAAEFLMGLSDSVICGHLIGENALSAVNLMQGVFEFVTFVGMVVTIGACVSFSTQLGAGHDRRARGYFTAGTLTVVGLSALVTLALGLLRTPVLAAFGASAEVTRLAADYWLWYLPAAFLQPLAFYLGTLCYADGNARLLFASYVVQLVANVALSIPLTLALDSAGCALGTGLGALASILALLLHFRRKGCMLRFSRHFVPLDVVRILRLSIGDASKNIGKAALMFALNAYVIAHFGSGMLPVLAVVVMTLGISEFFDGVGNAAQPLASIYIGEKNPILVKRVMGCAIGLSLVEGFGVLLVLAACPRLMLLLAGVDDPALVPVACTAVRLEALALPALALVLLFNSYYVFIGREVLSTVLTLLAVCVLPLGLFFAGGPWGATGAWTGLGLAPLAALFLVAAYVLVVGGPRRFPLLLPEKRAASLRVFDLVLDPVAICGTSASVGAYLREKGVETRRIAKAALLVEETLMVVRDRNAPRRIRAEVTVDLNQGLTLILRDDGEIFDLTDADARVSSLRSYLVSNLMTAIPNRRNLTTTGFNRNVFRL